MPPAANYFAVPRELNESVAMNFAASYSKGSPSAWSDIITAAVFGVAGFGVAGLITASISIWQAHRYLHRLAQLKSTLSEDLEKAIPVGPIPHDQPGLSGSKADTSTISSATIRKTPEEFYGLEAQYSLEISAEHEKRSPTTVSAGPSSARVCLGPLPQAFPHHDGSPGDLATVLTKFYELFFYMTADANPITRHVDSHTRPDDIPLQETGLKS